MVQVTYSDDEINEMLVELVNRMASDAELSAKDRAMLKRWRSSEMKLGSDELDDLVRKANDDFAQSLSHAREERDSQTRLAHLAAAERRFHASASLAPALVAGALRCTAHARPHSPTLLPWPTRSCSRSMSGAWRRSRSTGPSA